MLRNLILTKFSVDHFPISMDETDKKVDSIEKILNDDK
jgi:hypothetical protein